MTLSISEFSEMCQLPAQTLRFYHSEGLLVPADVDERTGYRSYAVTQVERAMLIATLRRAGLGLREVGKALADVDASPSLLAEHREALRRRRQQEDEALDDAQAFTTDWPQVRRYHMPETVVVSTVVAGASEDEVAAARVLDAAHQLARTAESCRATVSGVPWKAYALDTVEQKKKLWTREGPDWSVTVPVTVDDYIAAALPAAVTLATFDARHEISIIVPGHETMPKYAAAVQRLVDYALEQDCVVDLGRPRHLLHEDGIEIALAVLPSGSSTAPPGTPAAR